MFLPFVLNSDSASVVIPMGTADIFAVYVAYCDVPFIATVVATIDVMVVVDEEDTGNKSYSLRKGNHKSLLI